MIILLDNKGELSSNKLRKEIYVMLANYGETMRKSKREENKNKPYTPSQAKISVVIKNLILWQWLNRKPDKKSNRVYYSLTERGKFCYDIGLDAKESYEMEDIYQMILRTSAMGISEVIDEKTNEIRVTEGTSMEDILLKKDRITCCNYIYRTYSGYDLEQVFKLAEDEGVIRKQIVNNEIRYIINENLRFYVTFVWEFLYPVTRRIIENVLLMKRLPNRSPEYQRFYEWLVSIHGEAYAKKIVQDCYRKRKENVNNDSKSELLEVTQNHLNHLVEWRNDWKKLSETIKFEIKYKKIHSVQSLMKSLLFYTCPAHIVNLLDRILENDKFKDVVV